MYFNYYSLNIKKFTVTTKNSVNIFKKVHNTSINVLKRSNWSYTIPLYKWKVLFCDERFTTIYRMVFGKFVETRSLALK